jgi:hypothetical protein
VNVQDDLLSRERQFFLLVNDFSRNLANVTLPKCGGKTDESNEGKTAVSVKRET